MKKVLPVTDLGAFRFIKLTIAELRTLERLVAREHDTLLSYPTKPLLQKLLQKIREVQ